MNYYYLGNEGKKCSENKKKTSAAAPTSRDREIQQYNFDRILFIEIEKFMDS